MGALPIMFLSFLGLGVLGFAASICLLSIGVTKPKGKKKLFIILSVVVLVVSNIPIFYMASVPIRSYSVEIPATE